MPLSTIKRLLIAATLIMIVLVGVLVSDVTSKRLFVSFDVESEEPFVCYAFFSDNPSEPYKYNKPYNIPFGHTSVNFPININRLRKLRIDFGEFPGTVKAGPIRIETTDGKSTILKWKDFSHKNDIDESHISDDGYITIKSNRRDPYLVYAPNLDIQSNNALLTRLRQDFAVFSITLILALLFISCAVTPGRKNAAVIFFVIAVAIQLSLMATWMLFNLGATTSFGDAKEYLSLGKSLAIDEYRPIGYPIIVGCASWLGQQVRLPYVFFIYILQTAVSAFSALYAVKTIDRLFMKGRLSSGSCGIGATFAALYLVTFPMCGMMNFAAMSDSLALSATMLLLSSMLCVFYDRNCSWETYAITFLSFCGGSWIRGDRPYLFLTFGLIVSLFWLIRGKGRRMVALKFSATLALSFVIVVFANSLTQKHGRYGRPRTTYEFVLLDRIVWPHMTECYAEFPQDVRDVVSLSDAKNFDANNNNVMYVFAKKMNRKVGEERAHELYRIMAETVFKIRTKKVIFEIAHDTVKVFFAPFFQLAEIYNFHCHKDSHCINPYCYNPRSFKQNTPDLTWAIIAIPLHLFAIALLIFFVRTLKSTADKHSLRAIAPVAATFFGFSLLLAIFYSLGDGAHPNSRYSIIVDSSWALLLILLAAMPKANDIND